MSKLSTCGRCGGTIRHMTGSLPGRPRQWIHVTAPTVLHRAVPDDSAVSGPGRDDLPPTVAVTDADCTITGAGDGSVLAMCKPCRVVLHPNVRSLGAVQSLWEDHCEDSHDRPEVPDEVSYADPWLNPDAAARAVPPPF